jgi:crossover junction endodeoxyribonuclease RusA
MADVKLTLPWPPTANTYYRRVNNRTLISQKGRDYIKVIDRAVFDADPEYFGKQRIDLEIYARPPDHRKRDIDNLLKPLIDALAKTGRIFDDDSQISRLLIERGEMWSGGKCNVTISLYKRESETCG